MATGGGTSSAGRAKRKTGRHLAEVIALLALTLGLMVAVPASALGVESYNVTVSVSTWFVPALVTDLIGISSVSVTTTGPASLFDVAVAKLGTALSVVSASLLDASFEIVTCVGGICSSGSVNVVLPTVYTGEQITSTNQFTINGVPAGQQPVSVTFSGNGVSASWSGSTTVG